MKATDLIYSSSENFACFPQPESLSVSEIEEAFLSLSKTGGVLCVGVDKSLNCLGFPLLELPKTKSLLRDASRCLGEHPLLKVSVRNVDSNAENCVLFVEIGKRELARHEDKGHHLENLSCFSAWCLENGSEEPSADRLRNLRLIDSFSRPLGNFAFFSDDAKARLECRLYKGKEKSGFLLDERCLEGSVQDDLKGALTFLERNTKAASERRSYPREAFLFSLLKLFLYKDNANPSLLAKVSIFDDRVEFACPIVPLEDGIFPPVSADIEQAFTLAGLSNSPLYRCYEGKKRKYWPSILCTSGEMIITLFDELYREEDLGGDKEKEPLSDEQIKVLRALSTGPASLHSLMLASPYKSRAAFTKYVISPLMKGGRIVRVGKITSPKAVLKLV